MQHRMKELSQTGGPCGWLYTAGLLKSMYKDTDQPTGKRPTLQPTVKPSFLQKKLKKEKRHKSVKNTSEELKESGTQTTHNQVQHRPPWTYKRTG